MTDNDCGASEAGNAICVLPAAGANSSCGCAPSAQSKLTQPGDLNMFWKKIRGGLVFGIACLTSPCCTPIIIPLTIALLAGTPAAVWLTANVGWVFGALTLISVVSFVIGFRWLWPRLTSEKISKPARPLQPATKP